MWMKRACRLLARSLHTSHLGSTAQAQPRLTDAHMKAWQVHQYGNFNDLVLNDAVRIPPLRNPRDVLVRVHASSVNPIDVWMMNGFGAKMFNYLRRMEQGSRFSMEFPLTLGRDFSGTVVEMGPAVAGFKPGDQVWGATWPHGQGAHAEYCVVPDSTMTKKPHNLNHVEAASLPYAALTALGALSYFANMTEKTAYGKRILIIGAAGGVGTIAVQILKSWGSEVTAVCSTPSVPLLLSLGADTVIDYKMMDVDAELRASGKYDIIMNCTRQSPNAYLPHLKLWSGARFVAMNSALLPAVDSYWLPVGLLCAASSFAKDSIKAMRKGSQFRWAFFVSSRAALEKTKELVESEKVVPVIDEVFDFQRLRDAYAKVEDGHARGKTVISICE